MATINPIQSNVTAGEFSPEMEGQVTFQKYPLSARILENIIPLRTGAWTQRPGFLMLVAQKHNDQPARLIDFEYSTQQPYPLEFGANGASGGYVRFFRNRGQISVAATDAAIANGTFASDFSSWTDQSSGGGSISHDTGEGGRLAITGGASGTGAVEQSVTTTNTGQEHVLALRIAGSPYNKAAVTVGSTSGGSDYLSFEAGPGYHGRAFTPAASPFYVRISYGGDNTLYLDDVSLVEGAMEISSPYVVDDLRKIKYAQSADVLFLATGRVGFSKLERHGHTSWSLLEFPFKDGPYLEENTDSSRTLTLSAASGNGVTLTASGFSPFAETDVGRLVRWKHASTWGWGIITAYGSATSVTIDVQSDSGAATATENWRLGLFSDTDGHPEAVTLFQQRLMLSGAGARASRIDGSASSDFETMTLGTDDGDAIAYTISDGGVNAARWLGSLGNMVVGTSSGNFRVMGDTEDGPLTPTKVKVRPENRDGAADQQPLQLSNVVLSVDRHGRTVTGTFYSFEANGLTGVDLTLYAEHVTESGLVDAAWQNAPWRTAWFARADGELVGLVFARQENIIGWFRCPQRFGLDAVESVCTVPGDRGDDLYISVKRTVDGQEKRFIEVMADRPLREDDPQAAMFYLDCGLSIDNAPAATLTPGAVSGTGVTFTAAASVFDANDVGQEIRFRYRTVNTRGKRPRLIWATAKATITAQTGTTATADIPEGFEFPSTAAIAAGSWRVTVSSVTGADHMNGETVHVVGDGAYLGTATVVGGALTLPDNGKAAVVQIGINYDAVLLPQRIEGGSREGSMAGKAQRPFKAMLRFIDTSHVKVGPDNETLTPEEFRDTSQAMDEPVPLFSGDHVKSIQAPHSKDGDVLIVQDLPLPLTVAAIATRRVVNEGTIDA